MNCKQGDLAIMVKSKAGNHGAVVQCLRLVPEKYEGYWGTRGPRWIVDRYLKTSDGKMINHIADAALRPIRGSGEQDEMLRIVGLPTPIKEKVKT